LSTCNGFFVLLLLTLKEQVFSDYLDSVV